MAQSKFDALQYGQFYKAVRVGNENGTRETELQSHNFLEATNSKYTDT